MALSTAALGLVLLVAAAIVARQQIAEQYYLWRLESADEGTRWSAIEALAVMKSVRAVPPLIRLMGEEPREYVFSVRASGSFEMTPLAYAIYRIGVPAVPSLLAERAKLANSVKYFGMKRVILSALVNALGSPGAPVTKMSYESSPMPWTPGQWTPRRP